MNWVTARPFPLHCPCTPCPNCCSRSSSKMACCGTTWCWSRVVLRSRSKTQHGNWKETSRSSLELLQRCLYLDKDLVLPPMASAGPEQSFFVVASTDLARAEIMMTRIREQLGKLPALKAGGEVEVSLDCDPGARSRCRANAGRTGAGSRRSSHRNGTGGAAHQAGFKW